MKRKTVKKSKLPSWDSKKWQERCAWCAQKIGADQPAFGIEISLRSEAFKEFDPGSIQPLLLPSAGKTVAMMVATEDSVAKQAGKDAMFQLCSETCAKALQKALQTELSAGQN